MPIWLTNVMEWAGSVVAIIFAITSIIEVFVVRPTASEAHTALFGALMVAGLAAAITGWQSRRQRSADSTAITAKAETLKT